MEDPMAIIRRGLGVVSPAAQTLGLNGLGTVASEQMQTQVNERRKGITPDPQAQKAFGSPLGASVRDLFG